MPRIILSVALIFVLCACGGSQQFFDSTGFRSTQNHYRVPYAAGSKSLLGPDWRVANFKFDDRGNPVEMFEKGDYRGELEWTTADGETVRVTATIYDLLLSHSSNAAIWLRVLPVPHELLSKDVQVLAENYVNNLSGAADTGYFGKQVHTRRVATKIVASEPISLLGRPAHAVTFEVVDLDQLEMDPNAPRTRAEIVLAQTNFVKTVDFAQTFQVPGYLLVGYSNDASRFDEHLGTFRRFAMSIALAPAE